MAEIGDTTDSAVEMSGQPARQLLKVLRRDWPDIFDLVDPKRISSPEYADALRRSSVNALDFESASDGGRGESYRFAQRASQTRAVGIVDLFREFDGQEGPLNFDRSCRILDVLGGDGLVTRCLGEILEPDSMPTIITSDVLHQMVSDASSHNLPTIQEAAQYLVLKDNSVDGVVIAYGTHHIPSDERQLVCQEAYRVLKPGGVIVVQDYDQESEVSRWFSEVVNCYSQAGHRYRHFTTVEIESCISNAGFGQVRVRQGYDPLVFTGSSRSDVRKGLGDYLVNMYGLVELGGADASHDLRASMAIELASQIFTPDYDALGVDKDFGAPGIQTTEDLRGATLELPRIALVGVGVKPGL